jgi:hypothetical protein
MGEGFINWWYILVENDSILDMKGLSYSMSSLFDYLRYVPGLSRAQVFSSIFSSSACTPMDNYGCTWNSFETKDRYLDTVQYALRAGGRAFDSRPTPTILLMPNMAVLSSFLLYSPSL